jgi:hypothetical protein
MPVPETAVNEDDLAPLRKHEIRVPRQLFPVQPIPIPQTIHESAHPHLRLRIFAVHPSHRAFALLRGKVVRADQTHNRSISPRVLTVKRFLRSQERASCRRTDQAGFQARTPAHQPRWDGAQVLISIGQQSLDVEQVTHPFSPLLRVPGSARPPRPAPGRAPVRRQAAGAQARLDPG